MYIKETLTTTQIAKREGISKQRVAQILSLTNAHKAIKSVVYKRYPYTLQNEKWLIEHADLPPEEMAKLAGVTKKQVLYYRGAIPHRHRPSSGSPLTGYIWEEKVINHLRSCGHVAVGMNYRAPYDILVNGEIAIDVKSANIPTYTHIERPYAVGKFSKRPGNSVDFYIAIIAWEGSDPEYFIIPADHSSMQSASFYISWPIKRKPTPKSLTLFRNRWDLIPKTPLSKLKKV